MLPEMFFWVEFSKFSPVALVEGIEMILWIPKYLVVACVKKRIWNAFVLIFQKISPVALIGGTEMSLTFPKFI